MKDKLIGLLMLAAFLIAPYVLSAINPKFRRANQYKKDWYEEGDN